MARGCGRILNHSLYIETSRSYFTYAAGDTEVPVFIIDEDSYIDLTANVSADGQLKWTPPTDGGNSTWKLFSYWQRHTNQRSCRGGLNATTVIGNGSWTVDHFSAAGAAKVTDFWDQQILSDEETAQLVADVAKYCKLRQTFPLLRSNIRKCVKANEAVHSMGRQYGDPGSSILDARLPFPL